MATTTAARTSRQLILRLGQLGLAVGAILFLLLVLPRTFEPSPTGFRRLGMRFAVADLDGDRRLDLASVEAAPGKSSANQYLIRLQFGTGAESTIGVDSPVGGLEIAARDVNGDDSIDLVVTSAYGARVVGIFLNDGHGRFVPAEPGEYLSLTRTGDFFLREQPVPGVDQLLLTQSRSSFESEENQSCTIFVADAAPPCGAPLAAMPHPGLPGAKQGRAPPSLLSFG